MKTELQKQSENKNKESTIRVLSRYIKTDYTLLFSGVKMRILHTASKMAIGYTVFTMLFKYFG